MLGNGSNRLDRKGYWEKHETEEDAATRLGIHLRADEHICPRCKGKGLYPIESDYFRERCDKCWGAKKLDWVEMAMGKPDPMAGMSCSSSSCSSSSSNRSSSIRPRKTIQMPEDNLDILDEAARTMGDRIRDWLDKEIINEIIKESSVTK